MNSEIEKDDYNKGGMIVFLTALGVVGLFILYISFMHEGVNLNETNSRTHESSNENPNESSRNEMKKSNTQGEFWVSTDEKIKQGSSLYQSNCSLCHGSKGKGDGAAGNSLKPPPRDLVKGEWKQGGSPIELYQTISEGIAGTSMSAFNHLNFEERWSLVHFISSITQNKIPNDQNHLKEFIEKQRK